MSPPTPLVGFRYPRQLTQSYLAITLRTLVLALAGGTTALVAGVYFGFEVAINPAFAQLADAPYVAAMQAINVVILNPWFMACFFGAPLLLALAAWLHRRQVGRRFGLLLAATAVFWVGSLGVTALASVPLNDELAAVRWQTAPAAEVRAARCHFASAWNRWQPAALSSKAASPGYAAGGRAGPGPARAAASTSASAATLASVRPVCQRFQAEAK